MKNLAVLNFKSGLLVFGLTLLALTLFGCNELLQTTKSRSDNAYADDLMAEATRVVREGLADDSPLIRTNTIEVVATTRRVEFMPEVQRLLKDDFVPVRFAAALAVGDMQYRLAESAVAQLLTDRDQNVRIAAAYAMTRCGFANGMKLIRRAITSKHQTVRANAALLLGKSGDQNALKLLYWALRDKDSDDRTRFQAVEAIAMLGDEQIYRTLLAMLINVKADDKVMGIRSMGALGTAKAVDALITMLDDQILEVRLAAAEQLGMIGSSAGENQVLDVFTKNLTVGLDKNGVERVRVLTALAIGRIGTPSLKRFLPQLLKDGAKPVRIAAARAVFQCSNDKTIGR